MKAIYVLALMLLGIGAVIAAVIAAWWKENEPSIHDDED